MIDTNLLLSIAFSMISNFAAVVDIPLAAVPRTALDLERFAISTPMSATSVYLMDRKGTEFWLDWGAVGGYRCPGSFFSLQDPHLVPGFVGSTTLSSNDVLRIATRTLERLIRKGNPLTNGVPYIQEANTFNRQRVPFFRISWPNGNGGATQTAVVEIDGRSGKIVSLNVYDIGFFDRELDREILTRVHKPESTPTEKPRLMVKWPRPTTNYVNVAISNWVGFCARFGLNPGSQTNIAEIDWARTVIYTNAGFCPTGNVPVAAVTFSNNTCFHSVDQFVFLHLSSDSAFRSPIFKSDEEWRRFYGLARKDWMELVKALEQRVIDEVGSPAAVLKTCKPTPQNMPTPVGETAVARCSVYWRRLPRLTFSDAAFEDARSAMSAEFDLKTGEVKTLLFHDPRLLGWRPHTPLK